MSTGPDARRPGEPPGLQTSLSKRIPSNLHQRHLRHRAARRRRAAITPWSRRLVAAVRTRPALRPGADRDLLRLRSDRPFRELKAEVALSRFLLDQHDPDMTASLELAEQHLVGERLLDRLLDQPRHRAG